MTRWFWIAFEDEAAPRGSRARGALVVAATESTEDAVGARAIACLAAAGRAMEFSDYTYHWAEIDSVHGAPQPDWVNRPLDNDEARAIGALWTGGVASRDQLRAAMVDDEAAPGDPLFRVVAEPVAAVRSIGASLQRDRHAHIGPPGRRVHAPTCGDPDQLFTPHEAPHGCPCLHCHGTGFLQAMPAHADCNCGAAARLPIDERLALCAQLARDR